MKKVLVVNGPNLNMLGKRPKELYGVKTLKEIEELMSEEAVDFFELKFFQSNYEGAIVEEIQQHLNYDAIIINPAAYTHTSVAIHDALEMFPGIIVEVHLSEVDNREDFRKINFIRALANHVFAGDKELSYINAIKYLKNYFFVV